MLTVALVLTVLVIGSDQQCLTQNDAQHEPGKEDALQQVAKGELTMSINLLKQFAVLNPSSNFIFSPYSIHQALLMVYFGSVRRTARELQEVLAIPNEQDKMDVYQAFKQESFLRSSNTTDDYTFKSSNRIYVSNRLHLRPCMAKLFENELVRIDFRNKDANQVINTWVEENTEGQIKNLISELSPDITSTIVNAAFFKGKWQKAFLTERTRKADFFTSDHKLAETDVMVQQDYFNYMFSDRLSTEILEMPYRGDDVSMFVFLPSIINSTVDDVIQKFTVDIFDEFIAKKTSEDIYLEFPKFTGDTKVSLNGILTSLGLENTLSTKADFSGFTGKPELFVDNVIHQSKVEVNEEGTKAYAATVIAVAAAASIETPHRVIQFICDRPFVYVIYNKKSQNILFIGVYRRP